LYKSKSPAKTFRWKIIQRSLRAGYYVRTSLICVPVITYAGKVLQLVKKSNFAINLSKIISFGGNSLFASNFV